MNDLRAFVLSDLCSLRTLLDFGYLQVITVFEDLQASNHILFCLHSQDVKMWVIVGMTCFCIFWLIWDWMHCIQLFLSHTLFTWLEHKCAIRKHKCGLESFVFCWRFSFSFCLKWIRVLIVLTIIDILYLCSWVHVAFIALSSSKGSPLLTWNQYKIHLCSAFLWCLFSQSFSHVQFKGLFAFHESIRFGFHFNVIMLFFSFFLFRMFTHASPYFWTMLSHIFWLQLS